MTDADTTPEPEPGPAAEPAAAPRRGRLLPVLALVALVVAVVAAVLAVTQAGEVDDLRAERDDRREVARVASDFAAAYMTFDFADTDATTDAIEALVTADFAEAFADAREPLRESFETLETSTEAEVTEVFVGDVEDDTARALVTLDIELSSLAIGSQQLEDFSIVIDLVKVDGEWRVDKQRYAPQPDITGGAPSTTSVPPATSTTVAP